MFFFVVIEGLVSLSEMVPQGDGWACYFEFKNALINVENETFLSPANIHGHKSGSSAVSYHALAGHTN